MYASNPKYKGKMSCNLSLSEIIAKHYKTVIIV